MPAKFHRLGINFEYPDNWTLDEEDAMAGQRSITVCSPGGAFWSVTEHPRGTDPECLARAAVDAIKQEYKEVEVEAASDIVAGREMEGYDMHFFYLDLINSASVRCLRTRRTTYTVFYQAEDRDFERLHLVFQAITTSFINGLKESDRID